MDNPVEPAPDLMFSHKPCLLRDMSTVAKAIGGIVRMIYFRDFNPLLLYLLLVGTYVKEKDNNRIKGGKTGVIFWSKVYYLFIKDIGEAYILYINGR